MKKSIAIIFSLLLAAGSVFAQSTASALPDEKVDLSIKTIVPEDIHTNEKTAKVRIEYIPMTDEARIFYTCMYVRYDEGDAMNAIMRCLEDFARDNKFYRYSYMEKDKEKFYKDDRGLNWAQRCSHVRFIR